MLKHNKKKNGRIIYEQLMQLATRLALTNYKKEANYILNIVKEHFAPNTMLGKEKKLFNSLLENKTNSKDMAEAILAETLSESRFINEEKIEKERVDLINEIMKSIGKDLFSIPIKEYKLIASIQILFNEMRNNFKYSEPKDRIKIKSVILENMKEKEDKEINQINEFDNFTYKIFLKKFNEKYSSIMNEDQKEILTGWVDYLLTEDKKTFGDLMRNKLRKVKSNLDVSLINEGHLKSEYSDLLKEAREELDQGFPAINEESVHKIMRYYDLVDDLREINYEQK